MPPRNSRSKAIIHKASESQVAPWLASIFGVPAFDNVREVVEAIVEEHGGLYSMFYETVEMHPWVEDVPTSIMSDGMNEFIESVVCAPGVMFIVRDSTLPGRKGLWMVEAANGLSSVLRDEDRLLPYRGLINHFKVGNKTVCVRAVQLESCVRYGEG